MNQADLERSICRLNLSRRNPIRPAALKRSGPSWCTNCTSAGAAGGPMRESKNGFGLPEISHFSFLAPPLKFLLSFSASGLSIRPIRHSDIAYSVLQSKFTTSAQRASDEPAQASIGSVSHDPRCLRMHFAWRVRAEWLQGRAKLRTAAGALGFRSDRSQESSCEKRSRRL